MRAFLNVVHGYVQALIAAFQLLTRLPIPIRLEYTKTVCQRSVIFYPLVGVVMGLLLVLTGEALHDILPPLPAAALLLMVWIMLTGGLHMDGLMDTADGILSHRPREQMLEIMKDSRVGAMGVIVCMLQLLLKFSLLYTLLSFNYWTEASFFLLVVPLWSRWFMVVAIQGWPYARREPGMGSYFQGVRLKHVIISTILGIGLTVVFIWAGNNLLVGFPHIWPALNGPVWKLTAGFPVLTLCCGFGIASYLNRKLGGLTGDTYGALNELLETVLLLAVIVILK